MLDALAKIKSKADLINRIIFLANRSFWVSYNLFVVKDTKKKEIIANSDFLRYSRFINLSVSIIELAKLFQNKKHTQKQNLFSFIKDIKQYIITGNIKELTENNVAELESIIATLNQETINKISNLRNKVYAHLDDDFQQLLNECELDFEEIKVLLDASKRIMKIIQLMLFNVNHIYDRIAEQTIAERHLERLVDLREKEIKYLTNKQNMSATTTTNRIDQLFENRKSNILSIYFTAGFPQLNDTVPILQHLQEAGADMIEIGMPFSDPVADGPTIQHSSTVALHNGMTLNLLFEQLKNIRETIHIPLLLMGYLNPVMQYGVEKFCQKCQETGIDGLIIPDLPMQEYMDEYKTLFEQYGLYNIFLISPQTSKARIREIDEHSSGFIYMVSSASITGARGNITEAQESYFQRVAVMQLKKPTLIGFGISNRETFEQACAHAPGAIIGSAFVNLLQESKNLSTDIKQFVGSLKRS